MIQYVEDIIIPYVKEAREIFDEWKPALIKLWKTLRIRQNALKKLTHLNIHTVIHFSMPINQFPMQTFQ